MEAIVSHTPGWMVLTRKAAEVAGLAFVSRVLDSAGHMPRKRPFLPRPAASKPFAFPALPPFISDIADDDARYHRAQLAAGGYLFAGFYSDGRVRLATPEGRRFSGIMM